MTRKQLNKSLAARFGGFRFRLVGIIMLAVLPLVGLRAVEIYKDRQHQIDAAGAKAIEIAQHGADLYRGTIVEAETLLRVASQVPDVVSGSAESCAAFLEKAGHGRGWANGFTVIGIDGRITCATRPGLIGRDISEREYFPRAVKTREFVVGDLFIGRQTGQPTSIAALPVLGPDGAVTKVLGVTLQLDWFSRLAGEIGTEFDATVFLVDIKGTLLARFPERRDWIGRDFSGQELMKKMLAANKGWAEIDSVDGPRRIYGFMKIPGAQAHIAVGFDRSKVLAGINSEVSKAGIMLSIAILLTLLASIGLADRVARPLKILTAGAAAARNRADANLPTIKGYTEVESLAASLNELLADRKRREQALTEARTKAEQAERLAHETHNRLTSALEMLPEGVSIFDAEDRLILWNKRYDEIFPETADIRKPGIRFEELLRLGVMRGTWKDAVGHEEEWITKRLAQRAKPRNTIERKFADRYLRIHERRTADGGTVGIQIDVTELKRREISFRLLFDSNPLPMYVYDLGTLKFLAVNDAAVQYYGHSREQFLSMTILDIRPPEDRTRVKKDAQSPTTDLTGLTTRHSKADGRVVDILLYKSMLTYEGQRASLVSVTDITERKRAEARITHMAHHDGLTDLANRALFRERLEQSLAQDQTDGKKLALHCIDLDYFKNVNDTLGHPVGDALLRRVADRLRACVRETDIVARLGGDEFAIIQDGIGEATEASHLATRIIEALNEPYDIDGHEVIISASIGIAAPLPGERNPDQLLKNADVALYRVKNDGRHSYRFFEPEMDAQLQARRAIEIDLRLALSREEFEVHYQPLVDTGIGEVNGFEALLRWNRPGHGIVSPAEFIPLAEEIGLIVPLGEWVLRKACAEAVSWPKNMTVSVNLSPLQFRSGNLLQTVITALAVTGLPAQRLELEITESVLFQDDDVNLATLHQLRQLGVRIAMDDFGTGYSSLSYLRDFPFDRIKIDRSFVKELVDNPDCLTIACGIIGLATGLGMKTTAEGVETTEQMELLKAHGCNHMQGFLFGAAKPVQEIHAFLDELRRKEESVA